MTDCSTYSPELLRFFNLCDYSVKDLIVVAIGTIFWVISYIAVIRHGFKRKFIEMPVFVAVGNIAWEFIWSFVYKTNMGEFYLWGYRAWFALDLFIFYLVLKYGAKQFKWEVLQHHIIAIVFGLAAFFGFFFYHFAHGGYDTPIGATSAFFLSVGISTLYITLFLSNKNVQNFSLTAGVTRALGDTVLTIFAVQFYDIGIIKVMGGYVVVLDILYVLLLIRARKQEQLSS